MDQDIMQVALYMNNFNVKKGEKIMDQLKEMLQENYPHIDFDTETALMSDGILDSFAVVTIIAEIENMFDISVTMEYIQPAYFESVETMWEMIEELQ